MIILLAADRTETISAVQQLYQQAGSGVSIIVSSCNNDRIAAALKALPDSAAVIVLEYHPAATATIASLRSIGCLAPVILIEGPNHAAMAAHMILSGAAGYIEAGGLERLPAAAANAIYQSRTGGYQKDKLLQSVVNIIPDIFCVLDGDGHWLDANQAALNHLQIQAQELVGRAIHQTTGRSPDVADLICSFMAGNARAWESEKIVRQEVRFQRPQGQVFVFDVRHIPLFHPDGSRNLLLILGRDITEAKTSELDLRKAEDQIQEQLKRLATLHNIDVAITSSLDLRMTLNLLLEQAINELQIDAADIRLYNKTTQLLEYSTGKGFRTGSLPHRSLRLGEGLPGRAAKEHRIFRYPDPLDATQDRSASDLMIRPEFAVCYAIPLTAKGQVKGVLEVYHRNPVCHDQDWIDFLDALAMQAAIAIDNSELFDNLQRANTELALAFDSTLHNLVMALDQREGMPAGHTRSIVEMSLRLGRVLGMNDEELVSLRRGGLLHDIGKLLVPESILRKKDPLTAEEKAILRRHPDLAHQLLSPVAALHSALDIPYCHHENWDGSGYPRGLAGEQIPLSARVFALADAWDRIRMQAGPDGNIKEKIGRFIQEESGRRFDPKVVGAFFKHVWAQI